MVAARQAPARPGIIETLNTGRRVINRNLWVLLVPFLVDVLLWRGPQLSLAPLGDRVARGLETILTQPDLSSLVGARADQIAATAAGVRSFAASFNALSLLVFTIASVPNTATLHDARGPIGWEIGEAGTLVLTALVLQIAGVGLGAVYFGLVGQSIRRDRLDVRELSRSIWSAWGALVALLAGLLALGVVVIVPAFVLIGLASAVSAGLGQALALVLGVSLQIGIVWLGIYLYFTIDAVILSRCGPLAAARRSIAVVGRNFWPAIGLIGLIVLIGAGWTEVWRWLLTVSEDRPAGDLVTLGVSVGNAYVASILAAASMLFYWSRSNGGEQERGKRNDDGTQAAN